MNKPVPDKPMPWNCSPEVIKAMRLYFRMSEGNPEGLYRQMQLETALEDLYRSIFGALNP